MTPQQRKPCHHASITHPLAEYTGDHLADEVFHHAVTVLRMRVGDVCELFDGKGHCPQLSSYRLIKTQRAHVGSAHPHCALTTNHAEHHTGTVFVLRRKMDWTIEKSGGAGREPHRAPFSPPAVKSNSPASAAIKNGTLGNASSSRPAPKAGAMFVPELRAPMSLSQWFGQKYRRGRNGTRTYLSFDSASRHATAAEHPESTAPTGHAHNSPTGRSWKADLTTKNHPSQTGRLSGDPCLLPARAAHGNRRIGNTGCHSSTLG